MAAANVALANEGGNLPSRHVASFSDSSNSANRLEMRALLDQHDSHLNRRSPQPAPVPAPVRAVQAAPTPTAPPTKRSLDQPLHVRLSSEEFAERFVHQPLNPDHSHDDQIVGPFFARDQHELNQITDQLSNKNKRSGLLSRSSGSQQPLPINIQPSLLANRVHLDTISDKVVERWHYIRRSDDLDKRSQLELLKRQTAAEEECFVGNQDLSCYPTAGTVVVQNKWSKFIWNSNYPLFAQKGYVDVYLFQQDTDDLVTSWISQDNGAGRLAFRPQDNWWKNKPAADHIQPGQNISWPFYFVVTAAGSPLTGTTSRLATWSAVQTALPTALAISKSLSASASSVAAASRSSSLASLTGSAAQSAIQSSLSAALESSLHASGLIGTQTLAGTTTVTLADGEIITATANVQANGASLSGNRANSNGLALPTFAIVLISVLGFLALVLAIVGAYFVMRSLRRRRQAQMAQRGSFGSGSPMMAAAAGSLAGASTDGGHHAEVDPMFDESAAFVAGTAAGGYAVGASSRSVLSSRQRHSEESHPFTSDEASRMADAFRNALRNPEFSPGDASPGDGELPIDEATGQPHSSRASALLREELAAEGKDLQSVGDRKKPTWHTE